MAQCRESDIHPHHPLERAELFHVRNGSGCTEFEFLNLLHAFVLATKPNRVLETGTFNGMGTLAIASALHWNGFGILSTVDIDECTEAKSYLQSYAELVHHVEFITSDAEQFCQNYSGEPFDLAFIDSGAGRLREVLSLINRRKLGQGCLVFVHDASRLRVNGNPSWSEIFEQDCPLPGYTLPLSRGMRMMFAPTAL